jgi:hypothetical protein
MPDSERLTVCGELLISPESAIRHTHHRQFTNVTPSCGVDAPQPFLLHTYRRLRLLKTSKTA